MRSRPQDDLAFPTRLVPLNKRMIGTSDHHLPPAVTWQSIVDGANVHFDLAGLRFGLVSVITQ